MAYVQGEKAFGEHTFLVNQHTLIPRPDTEVLYEQAVHVLRTMSPSPRAVIELGVGSGALILSLMDKFRDQGSSPIRWVGTDLSQPALTVAAQNAQRLGGKDQVEWMVRDWVQGVNLEEFDVLLSNPPYIPTSHLPSLPPSVIQYVDSRWLLLE